MDRFHTQVSPSSGSFYYRPARIISQAPIEADICIYGATSGGVIAAVQAKQLGHTVVLLAFGTHIGGLTSSGLGATDIGNKQAVGGLARAFYRELGQRYGSSEAWTFEPHVAEDVFRQMLKDNDIEVRLNQHLVSVEKSENQITEIRMEGGEVYRAKVFIDASYEGDLMAKSGVSYSVGREGNDVYNEIHNGVHIGHPNHNFRRFVDPYKIKGVPSSGLLPGISERPPGAPGSGDRLIQAYNFRLCLTRNEDRIPFPEPDCYDPERYTLLSRYIDTGVWDALHLTVSMPNGKTDTNNWGGFSTDFIGANYDWPEADYHRREEIFQEHLRYTKGLFWFLTNDKRVPAYVREEVCLLGLPKDEFQETGGWPRELYIREARRMISDCVMTEHYCVGQLRAEDSIGLAAYTMDSHNCQRLVQGGRVYNEGNVEIGGFSPYPISYRSIVPKEKECSNLFVPFCLASSHIAFGSIRMEPVFMVLGQSSAIAASLALRDGRPVQRVEYSSLRIELEKAGQAL